jgi:hypothetical protein
MNLNDFLYGISMIALSYVSCATQRPINEDLMSLLKVCHKNNTATGISGLLLYNGKGTFVQILEGDDEKVDELYLKISSDPRHTRINCIYRKAIDKRDFSNWKMGFRNLSNESMEHIEGFSSFMNSSDTEGYLLDNSEFVSTIFSHFKNLSQEVIL